MTHEERIRIFNIDITNPKTRKILQEMGEKIEKAQKKHEEGQRRAAAIIEELRRKRYLE